MATKDFQYHLTFNGKFSNETYIEYFNPNCLDRYLVKAKGNQSSDIDCAEAIKKLEKAVKGQNLSDEECEQTFRKLHDMLCDDYCRSNNNPCEDKKDRESCKEQIVSENLYFFEEYQKAIAIIIEMVEEWKHASDKTDKTDMCQRMKCQWDNLPKNNRILFHGHRGSGKTSVTMSVAKSLEGFGIGCNTFKVLPIINPGYFDTDTNILKTIISNMFEMAKCIIKKADNEAQRNDHEELLKIFEEVYRLLGCIESPNKEKHTLETLNEISKASGMREAMQELVNKFIKILPCKAKYLVLVIDDVDMSVAYAATMLEQINKFLELDNLLILISANLGQLHNEMREHYSKAFEKTLRDKNQALSIDVEDLASKYLLKLFPTSRRINVERPVSKLLQTELIISNKKWGALQNVVLSRIWEKTRLLYLPKDENTLHPIIPTNLRELAQLINLLEGMEMVDADVENGKLFLNRQSYDNCLKNINTFKNYFMDIWVPTHLAVNEEDVFRNIPSDITEINKHLINSINVIGTDNKKRLMSREVDLDIIERNAEGVYIDRDIYTMVSPNDPRFVKANKISDIFNQPSNFSYGDLLLMIDKYETYFESEEHRRFSNAIKIYYSILLFETMFFKSSKVDYFYIKWIMNEIENGKDTVYKEINNLIKEAQNTGDKDSLETIVCKVLKKAKEQPAGSEAKKEMDKLNESWNKKEKQPIPIQKLIGGTVYYPNYFEIITSDYFKQKGPSYDAKRAFYHKVKIEKNEEGKVDKKSIATGYPLFSILYYGDIRPDRYDTKHIYDTTFDSDADVDGKIYVTFDILSILSNMLNPWHTVNRTDYQNAWNDRDKKWGEKWNNRIKEWEEYCTIKGDNLVTPNTILPFYSVDMMLFILKRQFEDKVIVKESKIKKNEKEKYSKLINTKELVEEIRDLLYEYTPEITNNHDDKNKEKEEKIVFDNNNCNKVEKDEIEEKVHRKIKENDNLIKIDEAIYSNLNNILIPLSRCWAKKKSACPFSDMEGVVEIISLPDLYKNHCISLILSRYKGGIKGRDALIKDIKKQDTIAEMYKYLVDQLWENDATEASIRKTIQSLIRSNEAVEHYYNELLELLMEKSVIEKTNLEVYREIFNKARKIFIEDSKEK